MEKNNPTAASIFKALGDENRWRILETLKEGERCACVLLTRMQIGQSTLSHHMKVLCDAGLITSRRDGSGPTIRCVPKGYRRQKICWTACSPLPGRPHRCVPAPKRRRQLWRAKQNCMC